MAVALAMREKASAENDLYQRLADDSRLGLRRAEIDNVVADRGAFVGAAAAQVAQVRDQIEAVLAAHPEAAGYTPAPIL